MMMALAVNATLALLVVVTLVFTVGDVGELLATTTVQPFVAIFLNSTGNKAATVAMVAPFILCFFTALVGEVATGSRQVWSFARVGGLPFADGLKSVSSSPLSPHKLILYARDPLTNGRLPIASIPVWRSSGPSDSPRS